MEARYPLAKRFLAAQPPDATQPVTPDESALESQLESVLAAIRAAWPAFALTTEALLDHVAPRARDLAGLARLHAADLALAAACAAGEPAAIRELERLYLVPLPRLLARGGVALDVAEEAVQALRARLLVGPAVITSYDGRGPLGAWLRVAATRGASNHRRDSARREAIIAETGGPANLPAIDPALALIRRQYGETFHGAIRDAFAALAPEERTILRLHFTDGLNLDAIARVLGTSRATAGRRMIAARDRVRSETLAFLGARIHATPAELESLLGVVRSTLDVSLGALVA